MSYRSFHNNSKIAQRVWSDFYKRSAAFEVKNKAVKDYIFNGNGAKSPPSIKRKIYKYRYNSPELIDDMFKISYEFLEKKAGDKYKQLEAISDEREHSQLLVEAEINNPEVQYNFQYNDKLENIPQIIDYNQAVYRHLGFKHWESRDRMLLMQRLETMSVIPDTLPTLDPVAEINIRFPFSTCVNKWIEPGEILSTNATSMEPSIKIQEYDHSIVPSKQLYTILIVNPDEPDLESDSYKTSLCFGLKDIKISYNDNIVDPRRYTARNVIAPYLPPVPEKNVGKQRFAVWVFRHIVPLTSVELKRDNFDIRSFVSNNNLTPIGGHFWRSEWDSNVASVREKYHLPKGRVFHRVRRP